MQDYIILPTCTLEEYTLLLSESLANTPLQNGYCRMRFADTFIPTDNIITPPVDAQGNVLDYLIGESDDGTPLYLGVFA